jgi:hypothetical protein
MCYNAFCRFLDLYLLERDFKQGKSDFAKRIAPEDQVRTG